MAASCNLLQISFPNSRSFPSISPSRISTLQFPSRHRSLPMSSSAVRAKLGPEMDPSVAAVVNPALRHASVLFFRSGYNVQIVVEDDEPEEVLLRRFRREVSKAGVIQECKRRRFFENKHDEKKRKAQEAGRRNRRRRYGPRFTPSSSSSSTSPTDGDTPKSAREDADDNWDY